MTTHKPTILVSGLAALLLTNAPVFAATNPPPAGGTTTGYAPNMDTRKWDLGAIGGLGLFNSGQGNNFLIGATGHWKPIPKFDLGGYFSYNSLASTPNVPGVPLFSSSLYLIMPEVNYHFTEVPGLYAGMKVGLGIYHTNNAGATTTDGELALGPAAGYDYVIPSTGGLSVGGQVNFINISTGTAINSVNFLAVVKY